MRRTSSIWSRCFAAAVPLCGFLLLGAIGAACTSSDDEAPAAPSGKAPKEVVVGLTLRGNTLTALGTGGAYGAPPAAPPAGTPTVAWQLTDVDGRVVASGSIRDPRRTRPEMAAAGGGSPSRLAAMPTALFDLRIPNFGGTLSLYESAEAGVKTQSFLGDLIAKVAVPKAMNAGAAMAGDGGIPAELGPGLRRIAGTSTCGDDFRVLIVPEGYTDMAAFAADAEQVVAGARGMPGYAQHADQLSFFTLDVVSQETGISDPDNGVTRRTPFRVSFGRGDNRRCVWPWEEIPFLSSGLLFAARYALRADVVVILANVDESAGCANADERLIVMSKVTDSLPHELGHALFDLDDEYGGGGDSCVPTAPPGPNTANDLAALPWQDMVTTTELPTTSPDPSTIGAYEGARYCDVGVYRPSVSCQMLTTDFPFCSVCQRAIDKGFADRAARRCCPADAGADASSGSGNMLVESPVQLVDCESVPLGP